MGEISNKTLAILVVIAILISVVGLFMKTGVIKTGKASDTEAGDIQADVMSDIKIAISGGIDFRDNIDLVPGGPSIDSDSANEYLYVAAVGQSRLDISYRADCNLFLNDAGGISKVTVCGSSAAEDNYYEIKIMDPMMTTFNDQDPPYDMVGPVDKCDGGMDGLDSFVWNTGYNFYQMVNIDMLGSEDNIALDCAQNEGFKVAIRVAAPPNEPPGDKSSTITFLGAACALC